MVPETAVSAERERIEEVVSEYAEAWGNAVDATLHGYDTTFPDLDDAVDKILDALAPRQQHVPPASSEEQ